MKKRTKKSPPKIVIKSVVLPPELWLHVERRIEADPELTISKYFRQLIRKDVAA